MSTSYIVYFLKCSDGTYYIGSTSNLEKRIHEHNTSKKGAAYTRSRRPVKVVYSEECGSRSEALRREIALKKLTRAEKDKIVNQQGLS